MYTEDQIKAISEELRNKIVQGSSTEHEVILLVLILEKTQKVNVDTIPEILMTVFNSDKERILKALDNARNSITDSLIDGIISYVQK